jgi:hypothetical protein
MCGVGLIVTFYFGFETRNKSMAEIEEMVTSRKPLLSTAAHSD